MFRSFLRKSIVPKLGKRKQKTRGENQVYFESKVKNQYQPSEKSLSSLNQG